MNAADLIWTIVGFLLTVSVLSYLFLGDNPLFRTATYAFIGVATGYAALAAFTQVIWPRFFLAMLLPGLSPTQKLLMGVPLALGLLLLTKLFPRLARVGNIPMAFLVGVGAAAVIGGAVLGTLIPQGAAAASQFNVRAAPGSPGFLLLDALVALVGTIATLFYFYYGTRPRPGAATGSAENGVISQRSRPVELAAQVGQVFLAVTLGAVFAGVFSSALAALIERLLAIFSIFLPR